MRADAGAGALEAIRASPISVVVTSEGLASVEGISALPVWVEGILAVPAWVHGVSAVRVLEAAILAAHALLVLAQG